MSFEVDFEMNEFERWLEDCKNKAEIEIVEITKVSGLINQTYTIILTINDMSFERKLRYYINYF